MIRLRLVLLGVGILLAFVAIAVRRGADRPNGIPLGPSPEFDRRVTETESGDKESKPSHNVMSTALAELSKLAKRIDLGEIRLQDCRRNKQLERIMWELRVTCHEQPDTIVLLRRFLESEESLGARLMAIFALAQPQTKECIELLAWVIRENPDPMLANAACLCFDVFAANGIGHAWNSLFRYNNLLGLSAAYEVGDENLLYIPEAVDSRANLVRSHSNESDLRCILQAMEVLLQKSDPQLFRNKIIRLIREANDRPENQSAENTAFRSVVERTYLDGSAGWESALDTLTDPRRGCGQRELDVLGSGLSRLSSDRKLVVLNRVAAVSKSAVFQPPFSDYTIDVLDRLSRSTADGGAAAGTGGEFCWALVAHYPDMEWLRREVLEDGSDVLRSRIATTIGTYGSHTDFLRASERVMAVCEVLMRDSISSIRFTAVRSMLDMIENKNLNMTSENRRTLYSRISTWIDAELKKDITREELKAVEGLRTRVK